MISASIHLDPKTTITPHVGAHGDAWIDIGRATLFFRKDIGLEKIQDLRHALNVIEGELHAAKEQASE